MRIATWNVNSLRARQDLVLDWLKRTEPDVLCMQETKVPDDDFPSDAFQRLGYGVVMAGEKSYNGVAIAARRLIKQVRVGLVDAAPEDDQRLISAVIGKVQIYCCYVPNGKHVEHPDFTKKLAFLRRLRTTLDSWAKPDEDVVVCGDFNVARDERDLYDPEAFRGQTHFHPLEHEALDQVLEFGLSDAYRLHHDEGSKYTWWDYRGSSYRRNEGMRIDYLFVSRSMQARCRHVVIDDAERSREKPSDHVPVLAEFAPR